jgi:cytochrome c-type biogenesis protein CcmE
MPNVNAKHDDNYVPASLFAQAADTSLVAPGRIDTTTGRILVDASGMVISGSMQSDIFTSTNSQVAFTASKTVAYTFLFSVNGSIQTPNSDYTVSGNILTLASGIPSGCACVWVYSIT